MTPPAVSRSDPGCQCRVASPQLAASSSRKPPPRTAVFMREARLGAATAPVQRPGVEAEHQRQQEGRPAEEEEQHVGEPGADRPDAVVDPPGGAGEREARSPRGL